MPSLSGQVYPSIQFKKCACYMFPYLLLICYIYTSCRGFYSSSPSHQCRVSKTGVKSAYRHLASKVGLTLELISEITNFSQLQPPFLSPKNTKVYYCISQIYDSVLGATLLMLCITTGDEFYPCVQFLNDIFIDILWPYIFYKSLLKSNLIM